MKFDINNYKGTYVMHCKTEEEVRDFCDYMLHCGVDYLGRINFEMFDTYTCFNFNNKTSGHKNHYKALGFTILEWSDFTTEFTKADLQNGMIVEYNQKVGGTNRRLVVDKFLVGTDGSALLSDFRDDLTGFGVLAINKVYKCTPCGRSYPTLKDIFNDENLTLIWERKEEPKPVEMTIEEICKALGKEIKIVKG